MPTVPTSADGDVKLRPGSIAFGSGRVIVLDIAARAIALSVRPTDKLADGSKLSYVFVVSTKLTMLG